MYSFTLEGAALRARVRAYLEEFAYPRQDEYRAQREEVGPNGYVPLLDELKAAARSRGGEMVSTATARGFGPLTWNERYKACLLYTSPSPRDCS